MTLQAVPEFQIKPQHQILIHSNLKGFELKFHYYENSIIFVFLDFQSLEDRFLQHQILLEA